MSDNSTRPQRRSDGFLTETGKQKLNSFIGEFLTERGKKVFYYFCSKRTRMVLLPVSSVIFFTLSILLFSVGPVVKIVEEIRSSIQISSIDFGAIGGEEDDQPEQPKQKMVEIPPDLYPGKWVQPLPGNLYVTQGRHGRRNDAVDLYAEIGTPVFASRAGRIILSETGYNNGHGNYIKIDHGYGVISTYCHLSVLYVEYGQVVAQGQTIGLSGNTGRVYSSHGGNGAHLHFGVYGTENPLF